jgi:aminoglycoside/choline kinase family phosphotransferase
MRSRFTPLRSLHAPDGFGRAELLQFYRSTAEANDAAFAERFRLCAIQRLMQALGAYGYLGHLKHNKAFLTHIPVALRSLSETVAAVPALDPLRATINHVL